MNAVFITRGLPASGKSTYAAAWVTEDPENRFRLCRDDLRKQLFNGEGVLPFEQEDLITEMQRTSAAVLLKRGKSVIIEDMNLALKFARQWATFAQEHGAEFYVVNFSVNVEECVRRDRIRGQQGQRAVGEDVIRTLAKRFATTLKDWPNVTPYEKNAAVVEPYFPDTSLPQAWIVDIDGTLAKMSDRGPFDWHRVGEDALHAHVARVAHALRMQGDRIIVMSGRDAVCRKETEGWLDRHQIERNLLLMRPEGNTEKDSIVKAQLFNEHVRYNYNVLGVFDDRNQVVEMWREMGIPCFQVALGDF